MHKLRILSVGKIKEPWLEEALGEYIKRLSKVLSIEFACVKNDTQLVSLASREPMLICFDLSGKMMDSETFSTFILKKFEEGGSRLTIAIGGAEGLPTKLKQNHLLVSLSPLTFTHQIVRLIIIEQIYRAFEIDKSSQYHK